MLVLSENAKILKITRWLVTHQQLCTWGPFDPHLYTIGTYKDQNKQVHYCITVQYDFMYMDLSYVGSWSDLKQSLM